MGLTYCQKNSSISVPREAGSESTAVLEGSSQGGLQALSPGGSVPTLLQMLFQMKRAQAVFPGVKQPQPKGKSPSLLGRSRLGNGWKNGIPEGLKDSASSAFSPAQTFPHLPVTLTWLQARGWGVGSSGPTGSPLTAYSDSLPTLPLLLAPLHPWAFAQAVIRRLHQVLAACLWSSQGLESPFVV